MCRRGGPLRERGRPHELASASVSLSDVHNDRCWCAIPCACCKHKHIYTSTGARTAYPTGACAKNSSTDARANQRLHDGRRNCVGHCGCWRGVLHHCRKSRVGRCWCARLNDWRGSNVGRRRHNVLIHGRRNSVSHHKNVIHDGSRNCVGPLDWCFRHRCLCCTRQQLKGCDAATSLPNVLIGHVLVTRVHGQIQRLDCDTQIDPAFDAHILDGGPTGLRVAATATRHNAGRAQVRIWFISHCDHTLLVQGSASV